MTSRAGKSSEQTLSMMHFYVNGRGRLAVDILKLCAPPSVRTGLDAQLKNLRTIHDTGRSAAVGVSDGCAWFLGVWSAPEDRTALVVHSEPLRRLTIAEAIKLERTVMGRVPEAQRRYIKSKPINVRDDECAARVQANIVAGRHWSHGLT
jgi:hypothetical protein